MTNSVSLALLCRLGYCTICKRYRTLRPELYHPSSGAHMEVHETDVALLIHPPAIFLRESSTPPTRPSYTLMSQFCAAPSPSPKSQTFTGFRTMRRLSARQRMCGCGHGRRYRRATMKHPPYTYSSFESGRYSTQMPGRPEVTRSRMSLTLPHPNGIQVSDNCSPRSSPSFPNVRV